MIYPSSYMEQFPPCSCYT